MIKEYFRALFIIGFMVGFCLIIFYFGIYDKDKVLEQAKAINAQHIKHCLNRGGIPIYHDAFPDVITHCAFLTRQQMKEI